MDAAKRLIARRVAEELRDGDLVNLGIGLPTLVARFVPPGIDVVLQSENGIVGMAALPDPALGNDSLSDAGGHPIGAVCGAAVVDSALSFGLIRGGHLDVTVLGGLEVDAGGRLANWTVPGRMVPGMGGAMDLVCGARRVIVAMTHGVNGVSKVVPVCTLPLTSLRRIDLLVTELAVIEPTGDGLVLRETAPGVSVGQVVAATAAPLILPDHIGTMMAAGTRRNGTGVADG